MQSLQNKTLEIRCPSTPCGTGPAIPFSVRESKTQVSKDVAYLYYIDALKSCSVIVVSLRKLLNTSLFQSVLDKESTLELIRLEYPEWYYAYKLGFPE